MISQYALGPYGWLMALCFAAFGVASGSLALAMAPRVRSLGGRVGIALLLTLRHGRLLAGDSMLVHASGREDVLPSLQQCRLLPVRGQG